MWCLNEIWTIYVISSTNMGNLCKVCRKPRDTHHQVVHVTSEQQFRETLTLAGGKLVVMDFNADWCQPCQAIMPRVQELSRMFPDVVFLSVNVDELSDVATQYQVAALPTFVLLRRGKIVGALKGSDFDKLLRLVRTHR